MADSVELPGILARVAESCGRQVAINLAAEFGGITVYVPKHPSPDCPLARAVGIDAAVKMLKLFGDGWLTVPLGPFQNAARARAAVRKNIAWGVSMVKAARAAGVHMRTAARVRRRMKLDDGLPLFDRDRSRK